MSPGVVFYPGYDPVTNYRHVFGGVVNGDIKFGISSEPGSVRRFILIANEFYSTSRDIGRGLDST